MKCIEYYKPAAGIVRVKDEDARRVVASGKARFVAKSAWKKAKAELAKATA